MSEQQSEFVYLDTIEEEPGKKKDVGDMMDNTEAQSGPDRRESEATNISLGQVWRLLHRLGSHPRPPPQNGVPGKAGLPACNSNLVPM